jgi:hypothetical protein
MKNNIFDSLLKPCHNPTFGRVEDDTHTPEMGTWESSKSPKTLEFDCGVKTACIEAFFTSLKSIKV